MMSATTPQAATGTVQPEQAPSLHRVHVRLTTSRSEQRQSSAGVFRRRVAIHVDAAVLTKTFGQARPRLSVNWDNAASHGIIDLAEDPRGIVGDGSRTGKILRYRFTVPAGALIHARDGDLDDACVLFASAGKISVAIPAQPTDCGNETDRLSRSAVPGIIRPAKRWLRKGVVKPLARPAGAVDPTPNRQACRPALQMGRRTPREPQLLLDALIGLILFSTVAAWLVGTPTGPGGSGNWTFRDAPPGIGLVSASQRGPGH